MPRAFSQIAYTPSVRQAQTRYGSREANAGFDTDPNPRNTISDREREFIPGIDTFFIASVGENGWPYVQHRGGPKGFLKILDDRTLGFADFSGNRQYISTGNVAHDDRVMLILMNFARRQRLKVWGRARVVHESEAPELIARLEVPTYRARIERAYIITVEALDFNCPQHITPRFTEEEIAEHFTPMQWQKEEARHALRADGGLSSGTTDATDVSGAGELELVITGIRQLTPRVRAYELRRPDGTELPAHTAGAHLSVPVRLDDGRGEQRSYSIASNPARRTVYEIAVLHEDHGRGGSAAIHRSYTLGMRLRCGMPRNAFALHQDARPAVLIAGGIGITPIKAMAQELQARSAAFFLHYAARSPSEMAYRSKIRFAIQERAALYFSESGERLDIDRVFDAAPDDAVFYVCGPARLIDAVRLSAQQRGIPDERVRYERFAASAGAENDQPIDVVLKRTEKTVRVPAGTSVLDALINAGVRAPFECRTGTCGTCATKVIDGIADHRDSALTPGERDQAALMCICISRAKTDRLVLDL